MMNAVARIVTGLHYRNPRGVGTEQSVLVVSLNTKEEFAVSNVHWDMNNPALRLMAYLGVRPSTMHEAEGSLIPVTYQQHADEVVPQAHRVVFEEGKRSLENAEWGPCTESADTEMVSPEE